MANWGMRGVGLVGVVGLSCLLSACGSGSASADLSGANLQLGASASSPPPAAPPPQPTQSASAAPAPPPPAGNEVAKIEGDKIIVNQRILYDTDKDQISVQSYPVLDQVAAILNSHPEIVSLSVEGHTDNQGAVDYNIKLSERRANAVVQYLATKGVKQPMRAPGYGAAAPVCFTDTEDCRAQNRRVVFKIKRAGE